jgi:two-component system nitrate/nitrite response regulator NarL
MATAELAAEMEMAGTISDSSAAGLNAVAPGPGQTIRVGLVDDHPALLMGLVAILRETGSYEIIGTGTTADEAVSLVDRERPDVLLMDLSMPGDAFAAIRDITGRSPQTHVVVFTAYAEVGLARRALEAGCSGFLLKGRPADELHLAIATVATGQVFISPEISSVLVNSKGSRTGGRAPLSGREAQLLECLLQAMSNKDIAIRLGLSEKTVKHYMTNLMLKLGAKNRLDAVLTARRLGLG